MIKNHPKSFSSDSHHRNGRLGVVLFFFAIALYHSTSSGSSDTRSVKSFIYVKASSTSSKNNSSRRNNNARSKKLPNVLWSSPLTAVTDAIRNITSHLSRTIVTTFGGDDGLIDDGYDPMVEITSLRPRELKRRLGREHGYLNSELDRMIHKNELINALAYELTKEHRKKMKTKKQKSIHNALLITIGLTIAWICRPLLNRLWDTIHVNLVVVWDVSSDRIKTCIKYRSLTGILGVLMLAFLDLTKMWLSVSILASWFIKGRPWYLFPTPNFPIYPGAVLGGNPENAMRGGSGPGLSSWGLNIGPMFVRWAMGWVYKQVEGFVGRSIAVAKRKKKEARHERKKKKKASMAAKTNGEQFVEKSTGSTDGVRSDEFEIPSTKKNTKEEVEPVCVYEEECFPNLDTSKSAFASAGANDETNFDDID
mmetsp:Transcript_26873/g.53671  ORF Transcript_26873/g.53671 Transcript_26873/m.53671 type:complete len:423 (-) Transcript_26873:309-1577(-)